MRTPPFIATLALLAALLARPARAEVTPSVVVDVGSGYVIAAEAAERPWFPASLAKLMTLYLAFEAVEAGQLGLDETLTASAHAAAQPDTSLRLASGDTLTVEEAIEATATHSANDAAVVLAERLAGSEYAFAQRMTATAAALGLRGTQFRNASGLPHPEQVTTARDMALLALALLRDFPRHYHYFAGRGFAFHGRAVSATNGLLDAYEGADGLKTGFTCDSGYNLVASAMRDGRRLVAVLLGASSSQARNGAVAKLLDAGFAAPLGEAPKLSDPADGPGAAEAPPHVLPAAECAAGAGVAGGRLPGWGLVFGAFPKRAEALAAVEAARHALRPVTRAGRPVALMRQREGAKLYSALLVGLRQDDAGKACKQLWSLNEYCLVLNPEVLNNPQSMWR